MGFRSVSLILILHIEVPTRYSFQFHIPQLPAGLMQHFPNCFFFFTCVPTETHENSIQLTTLSHYGKEQCLRYLKSILTRPRHYYELFVLSNKFDFFNLVYESHELMLLLGLHTCRARSWSSTHRAHDSRFQCPKSSFNSPLHRSDFRNEMRF